MYLTSIIRGAEGSLKEAPRGRGGGSGVGRALSRAGRVAKRRVKRQDFASTDFVPAGKDLG